MKHLILADPWGFPERPKEIAAPLWVRAIAKVYGNVNPLWILRAGMLTSFGRFFLELPFALYYEQPDHMDSGWYKKLGPIFCVNFKKSLTNTAQHPMII